MPGFTSTSASDVVEVRLDKEGIGANPPITMVQTFRNTVEKFGDSPALHWKVDGEWQQLTWKGYYAQACAFAKSLISLGVEAHQAVSIIGFNAREWVVADIGTILAGGIGAGIYTTNNAEACHYVITHSESRVVVCDGIAQLQKLLLIQDRLPEVKAFVLYNDTVPDDLKKSNKIPVYNFDEFLTLGDGVSDNALQSRMDAQLPGHCCTLIYTSGTTGNPKGVMLSHDNMTWTLHALVENLKQVQVSVDSTDRFVSFLPLSHIAAQVLDIVMAISVGASVYFADPDALRGSLGATLREVKPTIFFAVPRVWEKIADKMMALGKESTGVKSVISTWAKSVGAQKNALAQFGNSGGLPCGYSIANRLVFSRVREALGFDECKIIICGAAPLSTDTAQYFSSLDIPIMDFYGQSESTGPSTLSGEGRWRVNTVGQVMRGAQVHIHKETEEILLSGRQIMMGYLKDPIQTNETIDAEGWVHTGDCGSIDDDGFIRITGRIKELIITSGGENVAPVLIEDVIKEELPIISNAMLVGDKRNYLSVLLTLRVEMDQNGASTDNLDPSVLAVSEEIKTNATTVSEAKECAALLKYIQEGINRANARAISRAQNVGKFHILDKDFSVPGGELTPTLKLKRKVVATMYADVIDKMYSS